MQNILHTKYHKILLCMKFQHFYVVQYNNQTFCKEIVQNLVAHAANYFLI